MDSFRPPFVESFRPPFPVNTPRQLCPGCMTPHFPFCTPHQAPAVHSYQRFESFYPGQQAPHSSHGFNSQTISVGRAPYPVPDPRFQSGRPSEFHLHPSQVPQIHPPAFVGDTRERVARRSFQSDAPQFSVTDERNRATNGFMHAGPCFDGRNAWIVAERDVAVQKQRWCEETGERGESGEGFLPMSHAAEMSRLNADSYMEENRFERGRTGELNTVGEDGRIERRRENHSYVTDSFTGATIQGRSEYEPFNDALMDHMKSNITSSCHVSTQGSCDSRGTQSFAANRQQIAAPQLYGILSSEREDYQSSGIQRNEEQTLADENQVKQRGFTRGAELAKHNPGREVQLQNVNHNQTSKGVKRKHGQEPLSREEELLIEKGLLDDDLESFASQVQHGSEQVMARQKQGFSENKPNYFQQSSYQSSANLPEREPMLTKLGEPAGDHKFGTTQYLRSENQRNKRQEFEMERHITKFSGDLPVQSFTGRTLPRDAPVDSRHPSHFFSQNPRFDGADSNKDILYRQYLEWEAEEKHMEAVRRAERLAKEIQQREEVMYQPSSFRNSDLGKQEFVHNNRIQVHQQLREKARPEGVETMAELKEMQHICPSQGLCVQNHHHSASFHCSTNKFEEAHSENQMHAKHRFSLVIKPVEPHPGIQKRQHESLVQFPTRSPPQSQSSKEQKQNQVHFGLHSVYCHDQPLASIRSTDPHQKWSATEELLQEKPDGSASHSCHSQFQSDTSCEPPESFQPLLGVGSMKPPPPDSPPPPLPPNHPFMHEGPPHPVSAGTFLPSTQTLIHNTMDFSKQSLPPTNQGLQESLSSLHSGISQSQAYNLPPFQPQPPQSIEKAKVVDAVTVFRNPGRLTRPDRFVVILRGLPGSGKSYLAKGLRDVEVMNGGSAPRIHSMDDYFTCEVEKEEDVESGSTRIKKKVVKRVMEYCYEPELEEAYRASMLKAFRKTLEEGMFKFVIVDDRNVLIADFAQFWAIAKRSGYEAFIVEAPYGDVKGCAARNVHNFSEQQIQSMVERWEATPSLYLKMEVSSLFRSDDLNSQDIIEVDMDADDMERDLEEEDEESNQSTLDHSSILASERPFAGERWSQGTTDTEKVSASIAKLRQPSSDIGPGGETPKKNTDNALSGLMTTYGRKDKFVHWSDNQGMKGLPMGFSIGSLQKMGSLVIGPGPGYNGASNLPVMGDFSAFVNPETRKNKKFIEQLRAEREAFKALFARRRHRILGMDDEDDD